MEQGVDSAQMISNFFSEGSLPSSDIGDFSVKDVSIPFIPDAPSSYHDHFYEKREGKITLSSTQLFKNVAIIPPYHPQGNPPGSCVRTGEE